MENTRQIWNIEATPKKSQLFRFSILGLRNVVLETFENCLFFLDNRKFSFLLRLAIEQLMLSSWDLLVLEETVIADSLTLSFIHKYLLTEALHT